MATSGASTNGYIGLAVETDPDDIAQEAFDKLTERLPGWVPADGNVEVIVIEGQAQEQAIERDLASQTTDDIFRAFGGLVGLPPLDPTPGRGDTIWTMIDTGGYTVPEGTQVAFTGLDGSAVIFETLAAFTVAPGSSSASAVTMQAVDPGADTNQITGTGTLVDALAFVAEVALVGQTTGGSDGEETTTYLSRLARQLQLQGVTAVIPDDFENLALSVTGVERALVIDTPGGVAKSVSVAAVDANGQVLSAGTKATLDALLQAQREVNFIVNVIDPTYTAIGVTATVKAKPGYALSYVEDSAEAALAAYLSPANWGATGSSELGSWVNRDHVYYNDVIALLDNADGVDRVLTLTLTGGTADGSDRLLAGTAPLTTAGTLAVTAS